MGGNRPLTPWAQGALIAVASILLTLGAIEVVLRAALPVQDPYRSRKIYVDALVRSAFPPHLTLVTEAEPDLPGITGRNTFTTNNRGYRGDSLVMPKPRDEVRVFLVGGSTTECLYLDDRDALHAVVQRDLQERAPPGTTVKVYGAGKSGDRSDDHVAMIVHRILLLAPDAIVVFAGFNDLIATLRGYDYVTHAMPGQPADHRITFGSLARMTATETQVGRRMYYFLQRYTAPRAGVLSGELPLRSSYREAVERRRAAPRAIRLPALDLQPFEVNLRTIAGAVNAHGVALVLMTQQTTWDSAADPRVDDWHWMRYVDGVSYTATAMHAALEAVNGVTRRVGRELAVPVYDLASSMPKSLEFFYDDVHFNVRGAAVAGAELANVLQQAHLFAGG